MCGEKTGTPFEGVVVVLARLNPAKQPKVNSDLAAALKSTFGDADLAAFECLGRYDAVFLVRSPRLEFGVAARIPDIEGVKKLDVQYTYVPKKSADRFWQKWTNDELPILTLFSYVRVRDEYTREFGRQAHEAVATRVSDDLVASDLGPPLLLRGLGWPDYIVVAWSNDVNVLGRFTVDHLWGIRSSDIGLTLTDADPEAPVLSRTYTLLAYRKADRLQHAAGVLKAPQIDLRLRPGADSGLMPAAQKAVDEYSHTSGRQTLEGWCRLQWGADDAAIDLSVIEQKTGKHVRDIDAADLLSWYAGCFLSGPGGPANPTVSDLVTTTELRLPVEGDRPPPVPVFEQQGGPCRRRAAACPTDRRQQDDPSTASCGLAA